MRAAFAAANVSSSGGAVISNRRKGDGDDARRKEEDNDMFLQHGLAEFRVSDKILWLKASWLREEEDIDTVLQC